MTDSQKHLDDFKQRKAKGRPLGLPWTGERIVPSATGDFVAEHLHRYALALEFARKYDVLDIACGEGYGSAFLAKVAHSVVGVDCDAPTIAHATTCYPAANLKFLLGRAEKPPVASQSADLVVSFETLEHLDDHDAMLREIKRILRPGGRLLISTPDSKPYRKTSGKLNPFHLHELSQKEFHVLLSRHFRHVTMGFQRSVSGSWIAPLEAQPTSPTEYAGHFREVRKLRLGANAPYLVALASDEPVPALPSSLFNSSLQLLARLDALEKERESERKVFAALQVQYNERTTWAQSLDKELQSAKANYDKLSKEHVERTTWAQSLDADLTQTRRLLADQNRIVEERTTWAQSLDKELQSAKANYDKLSKEHVERTTWAQSLDADLTQTRRLLADQNRIVEERTTWAQSLDKELQSAKANYDKLSKEHVERTTWAQSLDADLTQTRRLLADQNRIVEERTTWAQSLDKELQSAKANYDKLSKEHVERTAWAQSLDADLTQTRRLLADQNRIVEERTTWAQSLDKELQSAKANYDKLSKEQANIVAQNQALTSDASRATALVAVLKAEIGAIKAACSTLASMLSGTTAQDDVLLLEETMRKLTELQRDLAMSSAEANRATASANEASVRADVAEAEVRRLTTMVTDAQIHVDHLLDQTRRLQFQSQALEATKLNLEATIQSQTENLQLVISTLETTRQQLARHEGVLICRLGARLFGSASATSTRQT